MSVMVVGRTPADTDRFRQFVRENGERMREIADEARRAGCRHHRFGVGDGFVIVVEEWESVEAFQQFSQDPQIAEVMQESGVQGEPELTFTEALETPDQF